MQHEPSTSVVIYDPVFADDERVALAGFLAGYRGATRGAYALDLRQFVAWCAEQRLALFSVRRAYIECYGRAWRAEDGLGTLSADERTWPTTSAQVMVRRNPMRCRSGAGKVGPSAKCLVDTMGPDSSVL